MSEKRTIQQRLVAVMRTCGALGKDGYNQQQNFRFRAVGAVMDHLHPRFAAEGVLVLPNVLEERTEERKTPKGTTLIYRVLRIRFDFVGEDGDLVSVTTIGEGMDSGDKAANKAQAVALKYALTQMLMVPYEEVDPDQDSADPSTRLEQAPPEEEALPLPAAPAPANLEGYTALPEQVVEKGRVLPRGMPVAQLSGPALDWLLAQGSERLPWRTPEWMAALQAERSKRP